MSVNDLPAEILVIILNDLPLVQQIRCRQVNKKWLFVIDQLNPKKSLVLSSLPIPNTMWIPAEQSFQTGNLLLKTDFSSCFQTLFNMTMFNKLEKLCFFGPAVTKSAAEQCLNRLVRLKELKVRVVMDPGAKDSSPCKFTLPRLESLAILESPCCDWILDTPNLSRIENGQNWQRLTFVYPEKIEFIRMSKNDFDCGQFVNLKFLGFSYTLEKIEKIETSSLLNLPNLEELYFAAFDEFKGAYPEFDRFISKRQLLAFADKVKRLLNNQQLRVNYSGFHLTEELLDCKFRYQNYYWINTTAFQGYLDNLDHLSKTMPDTRTIFLEDCGFNNLADRIPKGFLRKFVRLSELAFEGSIECEAKLIQLLDDCSHVQNFSFLNCSLTKHFYQNVLPRKIPFLREIEVLEERPMNFDFLFEFAFLETASIKPSADLGLIERLFRDLKFMFSFHFISQNIKHAICKDKKGFNWVADCRSCEEVHCENLDDLLTTCKKDLDSQGITKL